MKTDTHEIHTNTHRRPDVQMYREGFREADIYMVKHQ